MLDARTPVWNFAEVIAPKFLLLFETKRTVVGGKHLEIVSAEPLPELFLIGFIPQGWGHDVLRALEAVLFVIGVIEEQVLRARFGIRGQTEVTRSLDFLQRVVATQMDDIDGRICHLGNGDRPVDTLGFSACRTGQGVVFRGRFSFRERPPDQHIDDDAIFRVHAGQTAGFSGGCHCLENYPVVDEKNSRVRHE